MTDAQVGILVGLVLGVVMIIALLPRRGTGDTEIAARLNEFGRRLSNVSEKVDGQEKSLIETNHSVAQLRTIVGGLPTKDEMHKLELDLREVKGSMKAVETSALATQRMVERIDLILRKEPS